MAEYLTAKEISEITGKSKQWIALRAEKENWEYMEKVGRGGLIRNYQISKLPAEIQSDIVEKCGVPVQTLPALAPEAALKALDQVVPVTSFMEAISQSGKKEETWTAETAISEADLQNPRIRRILKILREVENIPRNWTQGKRKWIETVALRNETDFRSIYRWMKKYEKRGIAGIRHSKSTAGIPKKWTPEAIDLWIGLCLRREHRKLDRKDLYRDCLIPECLKRGWKYGCYDSANWWFERRVSPQLLALQRGGMRALDNMLPPVLRDYSDLQPFEILVGDQHRFDRWVVDEETGEVFRPEAYVWQDLRTRIIYGAAIDKKYDAWLIGLALRIGIKCFGAFGSIYTDNGRPECSRYLMEILGNIRALGMEWQRTDDTFMDVLDADPEDVNPHVIMPGSHKKAIVKNAKAKMIEGTFHILDTHIMTSHFRMPGAVKNLGDDIHWQDVDQLEAKALAKAGKLLTDREHALLMYLAIDYYNREKIHRGVLREWSWMPKPSAATPLDCLKACYDEGWRPKMISDEAADLIFLAKDSRIVHLGRITFAGEQYEHDQLLSMHKEKVELRYNPMNLQELHVFDRGRYLCTAVPIEYSSMKDMDLATRKIEEKRSRRKRFSEEFKKVTSIAPNFIEYSRIPQAEKVAALIGEDRKRRALEQKEISKQLTSEQLEAEVAKLEETGSLPRKTNKPLPPRPGYFKDDQTRYEWCIRYEAAGGTLSEEDGAWKMQRESEMPEEQIEYWKTVIEYGN